jgi:hypothetical protein
VLLPLATAVDQLPVVVPPDCRSSPRPRPPPFAPAPPPFPPPLALAPPERNRMVLTDVRPLFLPVQYCLELRSDARVVRLQKAAQLELGGLVPAPAPFMSQTELQLESEGRGVVPCGHR